MSQTQHEDEPLIPGWIGDESAKSNAHAYPAKSEKYRSQIRYIGCCLSAASAGWHDGIIGAILPYIQIYYGGISDERVSLVFLATFVGFITASLLNVSLSNRFGLARLIVSGAFVQSVASAIIAFRPPFLAIVACYSLAGFGIALQDTQWNTFVSRLPNSETKLGIAHAIYGVGALLSPTAATLLMKSGLAPPLFYLSNVAWCLVTLTVLLIGFGFEGTESTDDQLHDGQTVNDVTALKTVISARVVWGSILFISLYTGAETGEAGWIVSFLMRERDGGAMSGYASAAFYSGLTSSRIMLLPVTSYLSEKFAVSLYVLVALAMQIVVWATSSFSINFIATAATGFVMGPIYPVTVSLVTKATPRGYHPGAVSLMGCFGQFGSALFPFMVGSLADRYGITVLQPVLATMFGVMFLLWQLVPSPRQVSSSARNFEPTSVGEDAHSTVHSSL